MQPKLQIYIIHPSFSTIVQYTPQGPIVKYKQPKLPLKTLPGQQYRSLIAVGPVKSNTRYFVFIFISKFAELRKLYQNFCSRLKHTVQQN